MSDENTNITVFLNKPEVIEKFKGLPGIEPNAFIASALILINSDTKLANCTTMSLYKAVYRSATLELSLDPSLRQAWLVPRPRKIKQYTKPGTGEVVPEHWITEATFQPHYNGLRVLAERTGRYRVINVSPVYEGQRVLLNQLTGLHFIMDNGLIAAHAQNSALKVENFVDVTAGASKLKVIGYLGYYEKKDGIERTVWMTLEETHEHAKKWAPKAYSNEDGAWNDDRKRPTMEMKTVFRALTNTMDLSGKEYSKLRAAVQAEMTDTPEEGDESIEGVVSPDVVDAEPEVVTQPVIPPVTATVNSPSQAPLPLQAPAVGFNTPAPTDDNPDPVSDLTWKSYTDTFNSAQKLGLQVNAVTRERITEADIRVYIKEMEVKIKAAKPRK